MLLNENEILEDLFTNNTKLKQIGDNDFNGCSSLTEIIIPSSVTSIRKNAFNGCSSLTQVTIPSSVIEFGKDLFQSIRSFDILSDNNHLLSSLFYGCLHLENIMIQSNNHLLSKSL